MSTCTMDSTPIREELSTSAPIAIRSFPVRSQSQDECLHLNWQYVENAPPFDTGRYPSYTVLYPYRCMQCNIEAWLAREPRKMPESPMELWHDIWSHREYDLVKYYISRHVYQMHPSVLQKAWRYLFIHQPDIKLL